MRARAAVASLPVASGRTDRDAFGVADWGLLGAVGLAWGSSFLLIKIGLEAFHPGLITWARVALGALALLSIPRTRTPIAREDRGRIVVLSLLWVAIPFTLFPLAEQHITSAATGLLLGATPLFTGVIAALFFDRVPRGAQRYGIVVGFVGVALISIGPGRAGGGSLLAVLMVLAATLFYGIATNLAAPLQQRYGAVPVMARMLMIATVFTAPFGVVGAARSSFAVGPALAVVVLGVVGTGFAFAMMATLVGRVGGPRASLVTYLIPVVALALGVVLLGEAVARIAVLGAGLVVVGAWLASRREA